MPEAVVLVPGDRIQIVRVARTCGVGPRRILPLGLFGQPHTDRDTVSVRVNIINPVNGKLVTVLIEAGVFSRDALVGALRHQGLSYPEALIDGDLVPRLIREAES